MKDGSKQNNTPDRIQSLWISYCYYYSFKLVKMFNNNDNNNNNNNNNNNTVKKKQKFLVCDK